MRKIEDTGDYMERRKSWSKVFVPLFEAKSHLKNITSLVGCHTQVVQGFLKIKTSQHVLIFVFKLFRSAGIMAEFDREDCFRIEIIGFCKSSPW